MRSFASDAIERERSASLRWGSLLLGLAVAGLPIALVDRAYALSDALAAGLVAGELAPLEPRALAAVAFFAAIGAALTWRLRVDAVSRRWVGSIALALLVLATWRFGGSLALFAWVGLALLGVIYLRDPA